MSFGPPTNGKAHAKNRLWSTWTPLNNEETNNKIFEERRQLIGKWFKKWTDDQRRKVLEELLLQSSQKQLHHAADVCATKIHAEREDFTRQLPRAVSLYVFSFLDPRSLCRASQVCWHWNNITSMDDLWKPRCDALGWMLPFTPSPYELYMYKRHYVENISRLKLVKPRERVELTDAELEAMRIRADQKKDKPQGPWRAPVRHPTDIHRNNYLDNQDAVLTVQNLRRRGKYSHEAEELARNAKSKLNTGTHVMNRSTSVGRLAPSRTDVKPETRPTWAQRTAAGQKSKTQVRISSGALSTRSARDPPTRDLFPTAAKAAV